MYKVILSGLAIAISTNILAQPAAPETSTGVSAKPASSAYAQDGRGIIVRSGTGLCWRSNYWTPADAVPGCDGDLIPPLVSAIAPPIASASTSQVVPALPSTLPVPTPVTAAQCDFSFVLPSDETFSFNNTTLSNRAKHGLDNEFRNKLAACAKIESITVTGYTDHLGSDAYNQKLSEKRAAVVASYLKSNMSQANVTSRGLGKSQELQSCNGIASHKKLIDCLAPNRRVSIDVRGLAH